MSEVTEVASKKKITSQCDEVKKAFKELLIFALNNEVTENSVFKTLTSQEIYEVFQTLSIKKSSHLFYPYLKKLGLEISPKLMSFFETKYNQKFMYYMSQEKGIELIGKVLEKHDIRFLILKGGETRHMFQTPTYRVSNDIDILVDKDNVTKTIEFLVEEAKGEVDQKGEVHDTCFILNKGVHVEVHKALFSEVSAKDSFAVFNEPFNHVFVDETYKTRYHLDKPYFYAYLIAHLSKHVKSGEAWLPPLMDIYTIGSQLTSQEREEANSYLVEAKLDKFEAILSSLLNKYFNNEELTREESLLEEYILRNEEDNYLLVNKVKHKTKAGYIFSRLWLSKETLEVIYPNLKKYPVLLPYYEVKRWFRALGQGKLNSSLDKVDKFGKLDEENISNTDSLFEDIGL